MTQSGRYLSSAWLAVWGLVILTLVQGCGNPSTFGEAELNLIDRVQDAAQRVSHSGVRRIESYYNLDGKSEALVYLEEIQTDGKGHFAITPLGAVQGGPANPDAFFALQLIRRGFHQRYRDFLVRDLDAFLDNYQMKSRAALVQVAGRECLQFDVVRRDSSVRYEVALDSTTGLVLRYRQFDQAGQLYSMMEYESYTANPDLSGVVFQQPITQETPLSEASDLGFEPLTPRLLPDSAFTFLEATSVLEPSSGAKFAKLIYTDGVEPIFFVDGGLEAPVYPNLDSRTGNFEAALASLSQAEGPSIADEVRVFTEGPLTVVWGNVGGHWVLLVGRVTQAELIDMLTSALP